MPQCAVNSAVIVGLSLLLLLPLSLLGIFLGKYHLAVISIKDWLLLSYGLVSNL